MVAGYVATLYSRRLKRSQGVSDRLPVDRRAKESLLVVDGVFGRRQDVVIRWHRDRCTCGKFSSVPETVRKPEIRQIYNSCFRGGVG